MLMDSRPAMSAGRSVGFVEYKGLAVAYLDFYVRMTRALPGSGHCEPLLRSEAETKDPRCCEQPNRWGRETYFFEPRTESFAAFATRNLITVFAGILIVS